MRFCPGRINRAGKDLMAAVELTNESEFANGSCLYTNNASAIRYFRENVDAGMLGSILGCLHRWLGLPFQAGSTLSLVICMPMAKTVLSFIPIGKLLQHVMRKVRFKDLLRSSVKELRGFCYRL